MRNSILNSGRLILLLLAAFGYAQAPQPQPAKRARQLNAASSSDKLRDQIVAQERAGLDALKTGDLTAFAASTADDAIFVDARGPATKVEVMEHTAAFRLHDYTMTDIRFLPLTVESGLIVYTVVENGTSHGRDFTARVHVSSLWRKQGGSWLCEFSQETEAK
jgi:ketosteroid isomerase-like protein